MNCVKNFTDIFRDPIDVINFGELVHKLIKRKYNDISIFGMQLCVPLADLSGNLYVDNAHGRLHACKFSLKSARGTQSCMPKFEVLFTSFYHKSN